MIWLCSVICVFCYFWACNSSLPAVNAQGASVPFTIMKTHKFASVTYSCLDWINGISYAMWFPYVKSQQLPCSTGARICFILFALYKAPPNIRTCFQSCSCFVAGICAPVERVNWTFDSLTKKKTNAGKTNKIDNMSNITYGIFDDLWNLFMMTLFVILLWRRWFFGKADWCICLLRRICERYRWAFNWAHVIL